MKRPPRLLWVISFHHACNDGTLMALVALVPILRTELEISYSDIGLLGFGLIVTVVVQFLVGRYADRVFSRYLLEIGALLMGLSFVLLLLVSDFPQLFAAVVLMRIGAAFYHPVGTSWITREYSGPYLETALGVQSGVGNLGVIIALGTSGFLGESLGWKAPCILWAGLNFAAVILGLILIEDKSITTRVSRSSNQTSPLTTLSKMWVLVIPIVAGGALYQVTSLFGPLNLTETADWSPGEADLVYAVWIGVGTLTSYFFGEISRRFGRNRLLAAGYAASTIAVLALAFAQSYYAVVPITVFYGAFLMLTYPALFSIVTEATGAHERGTAFGILFGFQLGGGAVMVLLCGFVAEAVDNPASALIIVGALAAVSVLAVLRLSNVRGGVVARANP